MVRWKFRAPVAAALILFGIAQAHADLLYPVTGQISSHQNGGPSVSPLGDGNNLWDTNLTWTNNGPAALTNVYFVNDRVWLNNSGSSPAQWDNATQHWIDGAFNAAAANQSAFVTLDPTITDISIPSGFGLTVGDAVPAFLIASFLAPGASVTTDVDFELSPNISLFFFNGSNVGTPVPEPVSLALFGGGLIGLAALRRRRTAS